MDYHTIFLPQLNATYHSTFGAMQESRHVFMKTRLQYIQSDFLFTKSHCIHVFEAGFGAELNALLLFEVITEKKMRLYYYIVETNPLSYDEAMRLNYSDQLQNPALSAFFSLLHSSA